MGIDLQALSITSSFNAILSFFRSQENNSRWKDLTTGAEGTFLIRMLANVLSNISYKMITARRENYLSSANLKSSNLGIALNLGYSAYRGSNQKRLIEFIPDGDYTLPKFTVMGNYDGEYDILTTEDCVLVRGVPQNIKTVIGKVKTISFTAGTSKVQPFTRYETGISEDYVLLLDGTEIPSSNTVRDLNRDMYLVRTNPYESVDILYLNNKPSSTHRYGDESIFTLKYIELADIDTKDYTEEMFAFGRLTNTLTIEGYIPFESTGSIKVNAPLDHEVQHLIRSKEDYSERVKQLIPNVKQTSYTPVTPTYTLISYLKDDYTTVKPSEVYNLKVILDEENYFGTPLPDITVPRRETINLNIEIAIVDKLKEANDIKADIDNIIKTNYNILLGQTFDVYTFERLIESLSYVKWARISIKTPEWESTQVKTLGSIIKEGEYFYKASNILGTTGGSEPAWNVPQGLPPVGIGTESYTEDGKIKYMDTEDGGVIWRAYKRLDIDNIKLWSAQAYTKLGDYVYSDTYPEYMFKCVDLIKLSGASIPDTSTVEIGDFVQDGNLVWVCKYYSDSYPARLSSSNYRLGDSANINGKSFEVISYIGRTGYIKPDFELKNNPVVGYELASSERVAFKLDGHKTNFFVTGDIIKAEYKTEDGNIDLATFRVSKSSHVGNSTLVYVEQAIDKDTEYVSLIPNIRGTEDGDIHWELRTDIEKVSYNWNVYNSIYYDLGIK